MAATYFSLNDKVEAGLAALVSAAAPGLQVLTGKSAVDMTLPCAVCTAAAEGDEEPMFSGNYMVAGAVEVHYSAVVNEDGSAGATAGDQKAANQALVSTVFGAVRVADLAGRLTLGSPDLTVFPGSVQFGAPESAYGEKGQWIDRLPFRCYACGSGLAA